MSVICFLQVESQLPYYEVDGKLWKGAAAEGWMIFCLPGRYYNYVSPDAQMVQRRVDAMMLRRPDSAMGTELDAARNHTLEGEGIGPLASALRQPRRTRCGRCSGCLRATPYCGSCAFCLDKPQFGGKGLMPSGRCCDLRQCEEITKSEVAVVLARVLRIVEQEGAKLQRDRERERVRALALSCLLQPHDNNKYVIAR